MNDELKQLCLEIYKTERNKLEGMIRIYVLGLDLIRAVGLANPPLPQADEIILKLKIYLEPFEDICSLVGTNVSVYLSEELGIEVDNIDNAEQMAHNILKLIANSYFINIRKAAALASSQFFDFSQMYKEVAAMLKWPGISFNNFQADQIKCVQIFSQFAMLGDKLKKDVSLMSTPADELYQVSVLFAEMCSLAASYADFTQKRSEKSLAHVAPNLVPFFEAKRDQFEHQLTDLTAEHLVLEQQIVMLNPIRDLCSLLIQATDSDEQERLFQRWKAEYAESKLTDSKYPKTPKEIAELTQELSYFELGFQRINSALEKIIAQEQSLSVQLKQIQDALLKLDLAGRLDRMQAAILDKAAHCGITPVNITRKLLPISTFEGCAIPPKSSSPSLFKRFRAATSSTPLKLTRTHSQSSPGATEDLVNYPSNSREVVETKSEKISALRSSSSDTSSIASSSSSSPLSSKKIRGNSAKSPRLFSSDESDSPSVSASVSPTIRQRIDSLNALGGINLAIVRK